MYSDKFLMEKISWKIDQGYRKFAICPYGANGKRIASILVDIFGIKDIIKVDNNLSGFSDNILNVEKLRQRFDEEMCIVISVENPDTNSFFELIAESLTDEQHILNLHFEEKKRLLVEKVSIEKLLYDDSQCKEEASAVESNNSVKRIRLHHQEVQTWTSMYPLYKALENDPEIDVKCILGNINEKDRLERYGVEWILEDEYDSESDAPDAVLFFQPWYKTSNLILNRKYVKNVVLACSLTKPPCETITDCDLLIGSSYESYGMDWFLYDAYLYDFMSKSEIYGNKCVKMGNPKYDNVFQIFSGNKKIDVPKEWEKLKGKPTIVWAPSHSYLEGRCGYLSPALLSFDCYAETVFRYMREHQDINLIFRPHPYFIREYLHCGVWSENDLELLRRYCRESSNMILDETEFADSAYTVMDALMTDQLCNISMTVLPSLKPIAVLNRDDYHVKSRTYEVDKMLYSINNTSEIYDFLEMIRHGKDDLYEIRKNNIDKFVMNFDGKNSERMKEFLKAL